MFKSGGENVYPREVEALIDTHPAVLFAAVIAVPDEIFQDAGEGRIHGQNALSGEFDHQLAVDPGLENRRQVALDSSLPSISFSNQRGKFPHLVGRAGQWISQ
jgi:acyl-CoA synthetase (AMP-forming)/AMP-acid ligase II